MTHQEEFATELKIALATVLSGNPRGVVCVALLELLLFYGTRPNTTREEKLSLIDALGDVSSQIKGTLQQ